MGEASEPGRRSTALGGDSIAGSCAWSTSGRGFGAGRRSTALSGDSIAGSCAWSTSGRGFGAGAAFNGPQPQFHRRVVRVEHEWARLRGRGGVQRPFSHDSIAGSCAWSTSGRGFGAGAGVQRPSAAIPSQQPFVRECGPPVDAGRSRTVQCRSPAPFSADLPHREWMGSGRMGRNEVTDLRMVAVGCGGR